MLRRAREMRKATRALNARGSARFLASHKGPPAIMGPARGFLLRQRLLVVVRNHRNRRAFEER
jgi:hypothetical protein